MGPEEDIYEFVDYRVDIPVKFVGLGEKPEDIAEFDPDVFVEALFS